MLAILALLNPALAQDTPAAAPDAAAATEDAAPKARVWKLNPSSSVLAVLVKFDRSALIGGHDHVVQASTFDGTVSWNPSDPSACDIQISFPVTALEVDPAGSRERAGLEGTTSDGDKAKIRNNAIGKHQLEGSVFPNIRFKSTSCTPSGDRVKVTGDLSIHGVSKSISANMAIQAEGEAFSAKGTFSSTHGDWGMSPYTAALGALRNADPLQFTVDVKGTPK